MSKRTKSKQFIETESDDSDSDVEVKPKKKTKTASKTEPKKESKTESKTESKEEPKTDSKVSPKKESKKESADEKESSEEDVTIWKIGKTRKVKINEFRGMKLIDIREYYTADGEEKPGKKGISLTKDQWKELKKVMEKIDKAIGE